MGTYPKKIKSRSDSTSIIEMIRELERNEELCRQGIFPIFSPPVVSDEKTSVWQESLRHRLWERIKRWDRVEAVTSVVIVLWYIWNLIQ